MRTLRFPFLCVFLLAASLAGAATASRPENVVVRVVDGPRWSETWGHPNRKDVPNLARRMAPEGVVFTEFRNEGPTYTNAGHAAITTGHYQEIENSKGEEPPAHAGILQRFRAKWGLPPEKAWVVASKDKLEILADTSDPLWKGKDRPAVDCGRGGKGERLPRRRRNLPPLA